MTEFVVRPFAFMRLTHEALRAGFQSISEAARDGDLDEARARLNRLRGVIALHARQEEEVFFPLLDRLFDGAVDKADLRTAHLREDDHEAAVDAALDAGDVAMVTAALEAWGPDFENHLAEEERVMMPLTQKVADTLEGRAAAVREIMSLDWDGMIDVQLPYVLESLSTTKPYGPLRMFVAALQVSASDRYAEIEPVIRGSVDAGKASMLQEHGHLGSR